MSIGFVFICISIGILTILGIACQGSTPCCYNYNIFKRIWSIYRGNDRV